MAVGLPSVVSSIPANLQLIDDGIHGFTVPFDREPAIAAALLKIFRDPELRLKMASEARRRAVDNYSTNRVVELYETLFTGVMA